MILYKYTSLETAKQILDSARIGFSQPKFFNDPFDRPIAVPVATEDPIRGVLADFGAQIKSEIWGEHTAILSLTRSPTNALMWAHYAHGHHGAVLEINVEVAGFTDVKRNMIPAQFGGVIYSRSRSTGQYLSVFTEGISVGETHHFVISHYEKLQRLFLTKPLEWSYEEEVRVVKCLKGVSSDGSSTNESGNWTILDVDKRPLHCCEFPRNAIGKLFIGAKVDKNTVADLSAEFPDVSVHRAVLNAVRFDINFCPPH